jgi:hypothetical protein
MTPDEIEVKARTLLRETLERAGWYPILRRIEREKRIAQDVDLHWHLMVPEARKRLELGHSAEPSWVRVGQCQTKDERGEGYDVDLNRCRRALPLRDLRAISEEGSSSSARAAQNC